MSTVELEVNNKQFLYPNAGENPGWGEDATAWAEEVTEVLNSLAGPDDILQTTVSINNNVGPTPSNVAGLLFNTATVRSARIDYNIYRTLNAASELAETGIVQIVYKSIAGTWELSQEATGNAGVSFTITNAGQVQYTSTNMGVGTHVGTLNFESSVVL